MKVPFNTPLKDLTGEELKDGDKVITLSIVSQNALMASFEDEKTLSGEDKLKRWNLASKIAQATESLEVTSEEVTLVKTVIGKAYGVGIVGTAYAIIESLSAVPTEA